MRHFKASEFSTLFADLTRYLWMSKNWAEDDKLTAPAVGMMEQFAERGASLTRDLELKASHDRIVGPFSNEVFGMYGAPQWGRLKIQIQILLETLEFEVAERRFASVSMNKSGFLDGIITEKPTIFSPGKQLDEAWLRIWKSFPSLREECEEAVYCYVLERNTACVFHSMRIAEIGLRALARRMKVQLPKGKKLEWAEWQAILKEMSKQIDVIGQTVKAGPAKDELLDLYSGAFGQFTGFKDEFRNQVMHVRRTYDEYEAASALTRVRDFMQKLAGKIDEQGRKVRQSNEV